MSLYSFIYNEYKHIIFQLGTHSLICSFTCFLIAKQSATFFNVNFFRVAFIIIGFILSILKLKCLSSCMYLF